MLITLLALAGALQIQPQPQQNARQIARLVVHPTERTMNAGDTLRLRVEAFDAQGARVPNVSLRFNAAGSARFEGDVSPDGLVRSGSTGILPVGVVAMAPGSNPVTERVEIRMVPGPAARVEISPRPGRLVVGQRAHVSAASFSALGDPRADRFTWSSSAPAIARPARSRSRWSRTPSPPSRSPRRPRRRGRGT